MFPLALNEWIPLFLREYIIPQVLTNPAALLNVVGLRKNLFHGSIPFNHKHLEIYVCIKAANVDMMQLRWFCLTWSLNT